MEVDWNSEFQHNFSTDMQCLDLVTHLKHLPMERVYGKLVKADALRLAYGWLPYMALSSCGQLGTLLAKSFCERIMSKRNLVMTDGNTLLSDQELEIVVVLRMNREFMRYMRENYHHLSKQGFSETVIRLGGASKQPYVLYSWRHGELLSVSCSRKFVIDGIPSHYMRNNLLLYHKQSSLIHSQIKIVGRRRAKDVVGWGGGAGGEKNEGGETSPSQLGCPPTGVRCVRDWREGGGGKEKGEPRGEGEARREAKGGERLAR